MAQSKDPVPTVWTEGALSYSSGLTFDTAKKMIDAGMAEAKRQGLLMCVAVSDSGGNLIACGRMENCMLASINIAMDKAYTAAYGKLPTQVWREIYRVLKPGGKACVSDLAVTEKLPDKVRECVFALVGCVAGAVPLDETKEIIGSTGLKDLQISVKKYNVDIMENCSDSFYKTVNENLPPGKKLSDYVISTNFTARK